MRTFSILLLTLFAIFSVAYTLNAEKQEESKKQADDDGDMKSLMQELMKSFVAQVQEEEDQKSSAELERYLDGRLSQVQDDDDDSDVLKQENDDSNDGLLAFLQEEEEGGDDAQVQEDNDNGDDLLALLQDDDDGAEAQDDDGGDFAIEQGWFSVLRRFGGRVVKVCKKVNRYSRFLNCIPRMQAEMQKADEGDDDLAKDMLKRIANLQEDGGDGDAEAQFFRRIFRRARRYVKRYWKRPRRLYRRIRQRVGRLVRGYRSIRRCVRKKRFG